MTKRIILEVNGMHCASCSSNIERNLMKTEGIKDVKVNLMTKKAYIDSENNVDENEVINLINKLGYKASKEESFLEKNKQEEIEKESSEDKEIKSWFWKMILAWIFTLPVAFIMLSSRLFGVEFFSDKIMLTITLTAGFVVIFIFGFDTIKSGIRGFFGFNFNMDSLIMLGTVIAYITGILSLFFTIQDYSGISSMIMAFFLTGKYIESRARGRASQEIKKLIQMQAKMAIVIVNNKEVEKRIEEIRVGDIIVTRPGEKIALDGIVIKGESAVDESMISGESMPVDKKKNDLVIGGTINQDGILYIKVQKIGKDSFLANIIKLVEEASGSKIPIQRLADKITGVFVPIILGISILTFINWSIIDNISRGLSVAISVLVIACPCALGLATPTALMVGSGMGARKGILIRKGEAIQTMKEVKIIAFDKTGTITKGRPEVREIYSITGEKYLLEIAGSLEKLSEHPLAKAVIAKANLKKYKKVKNFRIIRGKGVEGKIGSRNIVIGNIRLMNERKIKFNSFDERISEYETKAYSVMIIAENNKVIGLMGIADALKENSCETIGKLNSEGYETVMITGDNQRTAEVIAEQAGIKQVVANVLPQEKENAIIELQKRGFVAFVGDGVNDAPSIKQANVGIAMGSGSDIAMEAGDIVLASGNISNVVSAINLSKATFRKIKQNLFWAFAYNVVAIPLAIAGVLNPVVAEITMALSSITVVTNANLLRRVKI